MRGGRSSREELLWTDRKPHSSSFPAPLRGFEGKLRDSIMNELSKVLEKVMGLGVRCFNLCFLRSQSVLSGNKINCFYLSQISFAHYSKYEAISLSLSQPMSFSSYFLPVLLRGGRERMVV